jgi:hypothetical protein
VPRNPELLVYLLYKNRVTLCHAMPPRAITYRPDVAPPNNSVRVMPGADGPYHDGRAHTEHTRGESWLSSACGWTSACGAHRADGGWVGCVSADHVGTSWRRAWTTAGSYVWVVSVRRRVDVGWVIGRLFPGLVPGQPIANDALSTRLPRYGIQVRTARNPALAADLPRPDSGRPARHTHPHGVPLAEVTDPFGLEVHQPITVDETDGRRLPLLPLYVRRSHDDRLAEVVDRDVQGRSGRTILVAGSSTGKTLCGKRWNHFAGRVDGGCGIRSTRPDPTRPDRAQRWQP